MVCPLAIYSTNRTVFRPRTYDRDDWAAHTSPNKHVKLYVGSPASQAAGSYYVDAAQMGTIIAATRQNYSSFGGVMLWDAGNARGMYIPDIDVRAAAAPARGEALKF